MKSKQTKVGEVTHGAHSVTIRQREAEPSSGWWYVA